MVKASVNNGMEVEKNNKCLWQSKCLSMFWQQMRPKIPCTILWDIFRASLPNVEKFSGGSIFWQQKTGGNLGSSITGGCKFSAGQKQS